MRSLWLLIVLLCGPRLLAGELSLAERLQELDPQVIPKEQRSTALKGLSKLQQDRLRHAEADSTKVWQAIQTKAEWEAFRREKLAALKVSLGTFPEPPATLHRRVTGSFPGEKFRIDNVLYESRPGWWVTGNLYLPIPPPSDPTKTGMPGILISHAHHAPKEQGELQDMGMTWARAGCAVLVIDHLGHGERRQHPFRTAADYPESFRASRQDYWFRYDSNLQLTLAGDSLMGWMAWDLMRGVDLLLSTPGVDPKKIILLGAVAGGGDPAGVTGALDERIAAVVPFNFGGPQSESPYPLPADAETSFRYAGSGGWESTRNLAYSASGGFLPWAIVGSIAPRGLIHAHEFSWDHERDPVWKRYQAIYKLYGAEDKLAFAHGYGTLRGKDPEGSHCTHIGRVHREKIHAAFDSWFGIKVAPHDEYSQRVSADKLHAWTPAAVAELKPKSLIDVLNELTAARRQQHGLKGAALLKAVIQQAGTVEAVKSNSHSKTESDLIPGVRVIRVPLEMETGVFTPLILLQPKQAAQSTPLVLALSQQGKAKFLQDRSNELAALLGKGIAVCLVDIRGTGELEEDPSRGRDSVGTDRSSTALMLGETLLGARLRDVRSVVDFLTREYKYNRQHLGLWGDSFSPVNSAETKLIVPHGVDRKFIAPEPLGGLLALLAAHTEKVACVSIHGGVSDFQSVYQQPVVLLPQDGVIPGLLSLGDVPDLVAALAPLPIQLNRLVDSLNRPASRADLQRLYQPARAAFEKHTAGGQFLLDGADSAADFFIRQLLR